MRRSAEREWLPVICPPGGGRASASYPSEEPSNPAICKAPSLQSRVVRKARTANQETKKNGAQQMDHKNTGGDHLSIHEPPWI